MGDYCHKRVEVGINGWTRKCGDYYAGAKVFCLECQEKYEKQYPQGWVAYPGDVCKHGFYTGGSGRDRMCPWCEMGE